MSTASAPDLPARYTPSNLLVAASHGFSPCRLELNNTGLSDVSSQLKHVGFYNCWTMLERGKPCPIMIAGGPPQQGPTGEPLDFAVDLITLDEYVASHDVKRLDWLKIDVDGYENRVLRGARAAISMFRPPLYLEVSFLPGLLGDNPNDVGPLLHELGYTSYVRVGTGEIGPVEALVPPPHTSWDVLVMFEEHLKYLTP